MKEPACLLEIDVKKLKQDKKKRGESKIRCYFFCCCMLVIALKCSPVAEYVLNTASLCKVLQFIKGMASVSVNQHY